LSPHLEIAAVARYSTEACREAVVFDSTQGYPGFRMVSGFEAYSVDPRVRMKRVALALGLPGDIHPLELIRLFGTRPQPAARGTGGNRLGASAGPRSPAPRRVARQASATVDPTSIPSVYRDTDTRPQVDKLVDCES
jgi:hypothetical protein